MHLEIQANVLINATQQKLNGVLEMFCFLLGFHHNGRDESAAYNSFHSWEAVMQQSVRSQLNSPRPTRSS